MMLRPPAHPRPPLLQFEGKSEGEYDQLAGLANNVLGTPVGKVGGAGEEKRAVDAS